MNFITSSDTFRNALNALATPVAVVANVFGLVLIPVLEMLFPVFKLLGMAVTKVALIFGKAWNALAKVINWAVGWLGVHIPTIDIKEIEKNYNTLKAMTWDKLIQGAEEAGEALRNVPQGLKIVSNRLAAAGYSVPGIQSLSDETGGGGAVYHEVHVHVEGGIYGVDELEQVIKRAVADANRRTNLATYGVG